MKSPLDETVGTESFVIINLPFAETEGLRLERGNIMGTERQEPRSGKKCNNQISRVEAIFTTTVLELEYANQKREEQFFTYNIKLPEGRGRGIKWHICLVL